jgi:hypothetical protein
MLSLLIFACSNQIVQEYKEEKRLLMSPATPLEENWQPDILLRLNYRIISKISAEYLQLSFTEPQTIKKNFFGATLTATPEIKIDKLEITDAPKKEYVLFRGKLSGSMPWKLGVLSGVEKYSSTFTGRAKLSVIEGEAYLGDISIKKFTVNIDTLGGKDIGPLLNDWLQEQITSTKPIKITEFDLSKTPIRGLRITTTPASVNIEMRSKVSHSENIQLPKLKMQPDWELFLHQETLLGWLRKTAFEKGIIAYGIAVDPTGLVVKEDEFELDLRLWKLRGIGKWWREYNTSGTMYEKNSHLQFEGDTVIAGNKSKRAGIVDPVTLLAQGMILDTISENLTYTLPSLTDTKISDVNWQVKIEEYGGTGKQVRFSGSIDRKE